MPSLAPAVDPVPGTITLIVVVPARMPAPVPLPAPRAPRHLLLSVFVV